MVVVVCGLVDKWCQTVRFKKIVNYSLVKFWISGSGDLINVRIGELNVFMQ